MNYIYLAIFNPIDYEETFSIIGVCSTRKNAEDLIIKDFKRYHTVINPPDEYSDYTIDDIKKMTSEEILESGLCADDYYIYKLPIDNNTVYPFEMFDPPGAILIHTYD